MKVTIVICSQTGNTQKLGELVSSKLMESGHVVNLTPLVSDPPLDQSKAVAARNLRITNLPDVSSADIILIGGPVWAFRPYPLLLKAMLDLSPMLKGKRVLPFVTHAFPFAWMTGNSSLNTLRKMAAKAGAQVLPGAVLSGSGKPGLERYTEAAAKICAQVQ
ncbi:MAG: NAD(P)H-dependent oxidoreductase [Candidatus Cloacimonetes bacterium]|nr:NAD(P)H-dependent oxidoreductase [Candidatus Cloacimonadota bacterium]